MPRPQRTPPRPHGKINLNQAVSTYGAGAICELRSFHGASAGLNSVMIAGLDLWISRDLPEIHEPVLANSLARTLGKPPGSLKLRRPPVEEDEDGSWVMVPAVRFPRYLVCSKCERLGVVGSQFDATGMGTPRCTAQQCSGHGVPARLVTACFHSEKDGDEDVQPGHIDDFPWPWWAFSEHKGPRCKSPQLFLHALGTTSALAGLRVECRCPECKGKVSRTLEYVFGENALRGLQCSGHRPWLDDKQEGCGRKIRVLLRGASNVFFHVTASAISIPPYSEALVQLIADRCDTLIPSVGTVPIETLVSLVKNGVPGIRDRYTDEQIGHAMNVLGNAQQIPAYRSDLEQRFHEREALREGMPEEEKGRSEFVAQVVSEEQLEATPLLADRLSKLVQVTRLREVRALRGFTRIIAPTGSDPYHVRCAPVSRGDADWLPAIEVRGEGVYIELDEVKVAPWEQLPVVHQRIGLLHQNLQNAHSQRGLQPADPDELPSARYVLIHTLAHLLIKQMSMECGYSSASLRERLYVFDGTASAGVGKAKSAGLLIYTSTSDADGTLGGLVRQGTPRRMEELFMSALEGARWCSSDPLCIESVGQGADARNLSACHACCLLSETSCENGNRDLDRGLLVGIQNEPKIAFFEQFTAWGSNAG